METMAKFFALVRKAAIVLVGIGVGFAVAAIISTLVGGCAAPTESVEMVQAAMQDIRFEVQTMRSAYDLKIDGVQVVHYSVQRWQAVTLPAGRHEVEVTTAPYSGGGLEVVATDGMGTVMARVDSRVVPVVTFSLFIEG